MGIKTFELEPGGKDKIIEKIASFLSERDEVVFAYIYGSFLEMLPFRDIDVALYLKEVVNKKLIDYTLELTLKIERMINLPVDVHILNSAPFNYQYNVIRGKLLFSRNEELRCYLVERAISRYLDMKPMIRHYLKEAMA